MEPQQFLEQLLESGRKLAQSGLAEGANLAETGKELAAQGLEYAKEKLDLPEAGPERDKMLKNLGIGAAAGGLLGLLIGTKTGRKVLSPAIKIGSLAALGGIGYKIYSDWQKDKSQLETSNSIANLEGTDANQRSLAIVKAMIGAAKIDGTIDAEEQKIIAEKIESSQLGSTVTEILLSELQKPLDIQAIADGATSNEAAVELYLASLLVSDPDDQAERQYLDRLAQAMHLDPELAARLEAEAFA